MSDKHVNAAMERLARHGRRFRDAAVAVLLLATTGCIVCGDPPRIAPADYVFHQTDWHPLCGLTGETPPPLQRPRPHPAPHEVVPPPEPEPTSPPVPNDKSAALPSSPKSADTEPLGLLAAEDTPRSDPTTTPPTGKPPGLVQPVEESIALEPERTPGSAAQPLAGVALSVVN